MFAYLKVLSWYHLVWFSDFNNLINCLREWGIDQMMDVRQQFPTFFISWHKLLKFCGTPKNTFFSDLTKKISIILIHSHQSVIMLAVVIFFLFDNLREKRSVALTKYSGIAWLKNSSCTLVENHWYKSLKFGWLGPKDEGLIWNGRMDPLTEDSLTALQAQWMQARGREHLLIYFWTPHLWNYSFSGTEIERKDRLVI